MGLLDDLAAKVGEKMVTRHNRPTREQLDQLGRVRWGKDGEAPAEIRKERVRIIETAKKK